MTKEFQDKSKEYQTYIEKHLHSIGWGLIDIGCGHFRFISNIGTPMPVVFAYDRIEIDENVFFGKMSICFYMKDVEVDIYEAGKSIGFRGKDNKSIFLNCYSF